MEAPHLSILKEDLAAQDRLLLCAVMILTVWGIFCIYSAGVGRGGGGFALRQGGWLLLGIVCYISVVAVGYRRLMERAYPIYALTLLLLLLTALLAPRVKGAQSWLSLGFFRFQPSEFAKISLLLVLSKSLSRYPPLSLKPFLIGLAVASPAILLVLAQPDAGSALVYIVITLGALFAAGAPVRYLASIMGAGIVAAPFLWLGLKDYQKMRLLVFLGPTRDPLGAGYNVLQSRIAVGSGGFWGKGFLKGMQSKLRFLPEPHTDFIFSVYSEEFGFLGACVLLLLFAIVFHRMITAALRSRDVRCKVLVAGAVTWIWFQAFESIGMSIGLLPITGLPLPFLSYGGSSLLSIFIALGVVGSIYADGAQRIRQI